MQEGLVAQPGGKLLSSWGRSLKCLSPLEVWQHLVMAAPSIPDPLFREAVAAIDAGDVRALENLLSTHPRLVRDRLDYGEGYFRKPYLLWFVAENPVRNGQLPGNIARVAGAIVAAARRHGVESLREQLDYALELVCSGRVVRECGVQRELIDTLIDAGAAPDSLVAALAHRELDAVERLLERGARLTLLAAVCTARPDEVTRLLQEATADDRQLALAGAALYGHASTLAQLIALGVDVNAYNPPGFHPHGTALHHAVSSGSLEAVRVLAEADADLEARDRVHQATPLEWAEHYRRQQGAVEVGQRYRAIADLLRAQSRR